ncbi:hypothetical protein [Dictyobacter kobayashii]|uniref:hypothetical protein n=1 Tax=Dictyobacter kobayashii TaxID=2014872 RepID=UPI0010A97A76|nr:hypothetical protein [Dictyobacter kobayashii]
MYCFASTTSVSAARRATTCGEVDVRINGTVPSNTDADQNENCFWAAYQSGEHAFLTYRQTGIDAGTIHKLESVGHAPYHWVIDEVSPYTIVGPNSHRAVYHVYRSMSQDATGLHLQGSLDTPDLLIPA